MTKRRMLRERQLDTDEAKYGGEFYMPDFVAWAWLSFIVGVVVICALYGAALLSTNSDHDRYLRKAEYAATYNTFTEAERRVLFDSGIAAQYSVDESYLIEIGEEPPTWTEYLDATCGEAAVYAVLLGLAVMMVTTFVTYRNGKQSYYFYADFPGTPRQRRLLLLGSLIAAPVYLVSYFNMRSWIKAGHTPANDSRVTCEDTNEVLAKQEKIEASSLDNYAKFLHRLAQVVNGDELDVLPDRIDRAKAERKKAKKAHAKAREEVKSLEKRRAELEKTVQELKRVDLSYDATDSFNDLWEISRMQGVTHVYTGKVQENCDHWSYVLMIDISLRFTYRGEIYDGGDWTLTLNSEKDPELLKFTERRSGLLPKEQRMEQPYYFDNSGRKFRFGASESVIYQHLNAGEIVEAMKIITECLHTIPDEYQRYIPSCYKRIM